MNRMNALAEQFYRAFYQQEWSGTLDSEVSGLSLTQAYQVQDLVAQMRVANGEQVGGYKVGCTSQAIRAQFGLQEPISGRLFLPHVYEMDDHNESLRLDWREYLNCAIEPEMVFTIGKDLQTTDLSDQQLIDAIDYISPGIELHHFKFWVSPPSSQELICSGGIHAGLVIGPPKVLPTALSFQRELFRVYKDGDLITQAPASEIMGGPLNSLRWLVNSLVQREMVLAEGSFVIPGSPVELVPITKDTDVRVEIEHVGSMRTAFRSN